MTFAGVNYIAVLVAAVVAWLAGAAWYMTLGTAWMNAHGWSAEKIAERKTKGMQDKSPFIISFIAELVMAWVLAGLLAHLGPGTVTIWNGIVSAAFIWLGFVATTMVVNNAYGGAKHMLTVIDSGHWLLVLVVMGAVIGAFGI